jgi:hypothetical protein
MSGPSAVLTYIYTEVESTPYHAKTCGDDDDMAQKIELGLYMEGDDARRFEKYMADPDRYDTPEGREMTRWVRAHGEELVKSIR